MARAPSNDIIKSGSDLIKRLKRKPQSSATIIANRATLRVLPLALRIDHSNDQWTASNKNLLLSVFRASFVLWTALDQGKIFFESRHGAASAAMIASGSGDATQSAIAIAAAVSADPVTDTDKALRFAGHAAAKAAEAASYTNASTEVWSALNADLRFIDRTSSGDLRRQSLWLEDVRGNPKYHANFPSWAREPFDIFDNSPLVKNGPWGVWLSWYRAILPNSRSIHPRSAFGSDLDAAIAVQPSQFWNRDPDEVTADIARLVGWTWTAVTPSDQSDKQHAPTPIIPNSQPAAIEPEQINERIALPAQPAARGGTDEDELGAALRALQAELDELATAVEGVGNIDRRVVGMLRATARLIPASSPTQDVLFRLAHRQELLVDYGGNVTAEWPTVIAAQYHTVTRQFDRTVRQFPRWREFLRNAAQESHSAEQTQAVAPLAEHIVEVLSSEDAAPFVDPAVPLALQQLAAPLSAPSNSTFDPVQAGKDLLIEDVLESVNNTLKLIAESALAAEIKKYGERAWDGAKAELEKQAPIDGANSIKWARRALLAACGVGVWNFFALFPDKFRWLRSIIEFLQTLT